MLEWYRANAGVDDVMRDTEQLVAAVTGGAVHVDGRTRRRCSPRSQRLGVCERVRALRRLDARRPRSRPPRATRTATSARSSTSSSPRLEELDHGVFLVDYPAAQASLARRKPGDPRVAERFELYVAGVELCNGFGELVDPVEQRARLERDQAAATGERPARLPDRRAVPRGARARAPQRRQRSGPRPPGRAGVRDHVHRRLRRLHGGRAVSVRRAGAPGAACPSRSARPRRAWDR